MLLESLFWYPCVNAVRVKSKWKASLTHGYTSERLNSLLKNLSWY